ncbi:hypothetical protein L1787_10025 [Acuticoccus sp. M5D2P5]|uniref:hypothetical protein n=1 Tax=Acuticoccus kalidii TaxID=2910977 RepID=UPI001F17FB97|nr:hypothetical protein [Acuticoccus kalidii]MCF3933751.1 hypothetical protein [Acuticoccus kalidii]
MMRATVVVSFGQIERSRPLEEEIERRVRRIEQLCGRLLSLRASLDATHRRRSTSRRYMVRLEAHHPALTFMVGHAPRDDLAHRSIEVVLGEAFDALEHQIKRWRWRHSEAVGAHAHAHGQPQANAHPNAASLCAPSAADHPIADPRTVDPTATTEAAVQPLV